MGIYDRDYMRGSAGGSGNKWLIYIAFGIIAIFILAEIQNRVQSNYYFDKILNDSFENHQEVEESQSLPIEIRRKGLGNFFCDSGKLIAIDPTYETDVLSDPGCAKLVRCEKGQWNASVLLKDFTGASKFENCELEIVHQSIQNSSLLQWKLESVDICVDTGQVGFFDIEKYRNLEYLSLKDVKWSFDGKPAIKEDLWYSYCCELTSSKDLAGVIPGGVVSAAGRGDGSYSLYSGTHESSAIVGLKLIFIR